MLAQRIAGGELAPEAVLSETGVAAMLNISRAPARQALAALVERGLVKKGARRGYVVCRPPAGDPAASDASPAAPHSGPAPVETGGLAVAARASWQAIYQEVETELAARIAFGSWRVVEADLARHYRVSRTVARDVLGRLQQRGIVDKDERSHWVAPALTPERVRGLYEVRAILEPAALTRAARHVPPAMVRRMLSETEVALGDPDAIDGDLLFRLEEDLHVTLLGRCDNQWLMTAIRSPQSLLVAHHFLYRWSPRLFETEPFLPEHRAILVDLLAGNVDRAAKGMEQHLLASSERASARVAAVNSLGSYDPSPYLRRL